jgi:hypothetical protein
MNTVIANQIEKEIDTKIAKASGELYSAIASLEYAKERIMKCVPNRLWGMPMEQIIADSEMLEKRPNTIAKYVSSHAVMVEKTNVLEEAKKEYKGWSRFFDVAGGHIHSTRSCSSCNKRGKITQFGWVPELSGLTEAEAVEMLGSRLCTVCFPSAPVEWSNHYEVLKAEKLARKAGN